VQRVQGTSTHCPALGFVGNQLHQHKWQFRGAHDAYGIVCLKEPDDIAKILGMVANYDGDTVTSRLDNVVATPRNEAAADKSDVSEAVDGR
jgi:hypothetical protein